MSYTGVKVEGAAQWDSVPTPMTVVKIIPFNNLGLTVLKVGRVYMLTQSLYIHNIYIRLPKYNNNYKWNAY